MSHAMLESASARASIAVLRALTVRDFRNLSAVELEVPAAGFVVVGENGHGKTNLLEAIYYCHLFRSLRGARDHELVRFGARSFYVGCSAAGTSSDRMSAAYERAARRKKIVLDGTECSRLSDALGSLPCVTLSPRDVELVAGAPAMRRRYLDVMLASTSRPYLAALQLYRATLVRRNATLRLWNKAPNASARVRVWEEALARHGALLWRERTAWVNRVREQFAQRCAEIGEREPVDLRYRSSVDMGNEPDAESAEPILAEALAAHRERDLQRGLTHVGPHRDDLEVRLGAHPMRTFGSAGQQRTAAIALRLMERLTFRERSGREPIMLLDDPFAELDPGRAARVLDLLAQSDAMGHAARGQVVVAVPRPADIPTELTGLQRFSIHDGVVTPCGA